MWKHSGDKARERRLRRAAAKLGLRLEKSRTRAPGSRDYGRYRLVERSQGLVVMGGSEAAFDATLSEIEAYLGHQH